MTLCHDSFDSPIGPITVVSDGDVLHHLVLAQSRQAVAGSATWQRDGQHPLLQRARRQLLDYLHGHTTGFDLPLATLGTAFQLRVWAGLQDIDYGQTWSYAQLAAHIGHPGASRAVGAANARNPLPLLRPCHRVIGSSGALTGYSGGLAIKQALLQLETGATPLLPAALTP